MPGGGLTAPKKLSAELADIVGKKQASRAELMKLLWAYIKKNNLQVRYKRRTLSIAQTLNISFPSPLNSGPRQQAVLHPRQEDGQGLRL